MWIFTVDGFYSVVHQPKYCGPAEVVVRTRVREDLERFLEQLESMGFPVEAESEILEFVGTDYAYRAIVERSAWSWYLAEKANELTYPNFKNEAAHGDEARSRAYFGVWSKMKRWQDDEKRARQS